MNLLYNANIIRAGNHSDGNTFSQAVQPQNLSHLGLVPRPLPSQWFVAQPCRHHLCRGCVSRARPLLRTPAPSPFLRLSLLGHHLVVMAPWAAPLRLPGLCVLRMGTIMCFPVRVVVRIKGTPLEVLSTEPSTFANVH